MAAAGVPPRRPACSAPTRRSIFSAPDARKYRGIVADRPRELGIEFVDIDDINDEGLLFDEDDRIRVLEKFRAEGVDGLFLPHCNFGTEYVYSASRKAPVWRSQRLS